MLRSYFKLLTSDSPYRYRKTVRVSPHVKTKNFGNEVLLFATPERLTRQADEIIKDPHNKFSGGFWEVYAKRINESIHILSITECAKILDAFAQRSDRSDLIAGICHFLIRDLQKREIVKTVSTDLESLLRVIRVFEDSMIAVPEEVYDKLLVGITENCHNISRDDLLKTVNSLKVLRRGRLELTKVDRILIGRLLRILGVESPSDLRYEAVYDVLGLSRN